MDISHLIEIIGACIGLAYLYLEYKASLWLWSVGILMSLFYIVIFYHSKFYADMGIYFYYLGANIFGLAVWKRRAQTHNEKAACSGITHIPRKYILPAAGAILLFWVALWQLLDRVTDSPVALGDAFTTALSIVAMWLMARKYLEHWWLWVVVNSVSVGLYFWKGLYPTGVLFVIYTAVSVFGYYRWLRFKSEAWPAGGK
ncbi:MAG: nicotinamide riboside transporter PnuC [Bacteroidales bacterium]|jgi:nicotinamide mononucleotide transporter|nr:nicotinamide riboside transporter PnuC [Bacteroidales bacterium]